MKEKKRMFKLRNGMIIKCENEDLVWARVVGEFQDSEVESLFFEDGEDICLWEEDDGSITGGSFGSDYDVVKELFDEGGEG